MRTKIYAKNKKRRSNDVPHDLRCNQRMRKQRHEILATSFVSSLKCLDKMKLEKQKRKEKRKKRCFMQTKANLAGTSAPIHMRTGKNRR